MTCSMRILLGRAGILIGLWVFLACLTVRAETNGLSSGTNGLWFPVGEELLFAGYWGILPVGEARVWTEWIEEDGRRLLAIKLTAESSMVVSAIFPVRDYLESIVDPVTFLPIRYTQNIKEGGRERDETLTFDHKAGKAIWKSIRPGSTNAPVVVEIRPDTRDVLSIMFYMRSKSFAVGRTERCHVLFDDKIYDLTVTGLKHEDVYLSRFGDVRCLELEPKAKFGEVFVRKGSVNMWISDDERRICTKALAIVPLASVKAFLQSVKGPGEDFWTSGKRRRK